MSIEGLERLLKRLDLLQVVTDKIEAHDKEDHHNALDVDVKKQARQIEDNDSVSDYHVSFNQHSYEKYN